MTKARTDAVEEPFVPRDPGTRRCDGADCHAEGVYRAPVAPDRLDEHYWFCLEHIRAYNSTWNFFRDRSEEEIEAQIRKDQVWQRPSWPFGGAPYGSQSAFRDDYGIFTEGEATNRPAKPKSEEEIALETLNLGCEASFDAVKTRYKELVKELHPDANGGDREAEERLKVVNQAYGVLKASLAT